MSQEQSSQPAISDKPFGESSDSTFKISLGVGLALMAALAGMQWVSSANANAKPVPTVEAKTSSADSAVYRCADGRVSFTPCS